MSSRTSRIDSALRPDVRGVPVTSSQPAAVTLLDQAVVGLVGHRACTAGLLERALAADPGLVPALCMQAFGSLCLGRSDMLAVAADKLRDARAALAARGGGSERERGLVQAIDAWLRREPLNAAACLVQVLREQPRDLLAFKLNHALNFILGRSHAMRASCEAVLPYWDATVPGYGYVLGCYAFALEETGALAAAERTGRRAVELEPTDAWGAHAVAHVFESRGLAREGVAWLDEAETQLQGCNNFEGHLAWHRGLFHLQLGEWEQALSLYDTRIARHLGRDYRDVCNGATLLWRLQREGVELGARWGQLAELARARVGDHGLAFADVHYVLALTGAGDHASAQRFVVSMRRAAHSGSGLYAEVAREVGVPAAQAIVELAIDRPDAAVDALLPAMGTSARLGGSSAQRDILVQLLIEAACSGSRPGLAQKLLRDRLAQRSGDRFALQRLEQTEISRHQLPGRNIARIAA